MKSLSLLPFQINEFVVYVFIEISFLYSNMNRSILPDFDCLKKGGNTFSSDLSGEGARELLEDAPPPPCTPKFVLTLKLLPPPSAPDAMPALSLLVKNCLPVTALVKAPAGANIGTGSAVDPRIVCNEDPTISVLFSPKLDAAAEWIWNKDEEECGEDGAEDTGEAG
jgi:hypothetical protein